MTTAARSSQSRDEIVRKLFDLFRHRGFEGAALSDISEATGLGRSSLYHHFPGGKDEMVSAVADFAHRQIETNILAPLAGEGNLADRVEAMLAMTREMYDCGREPCLVASLMVSPGLAPDSAGKVQAILKDWIAALAAALEGAGIPAAEAKRRATAALIDIQGALLVARASGDTGVFTGAMETARRNLLAPA
ncbi:TetR/AcrR family transcriptional regulator [Hyphomonas adhaerens]|uniref:TetR/AcrR family transcriptional regulator n=1 Tax=Hyphomonas adhaerens TaxID=81029 RepID=UPI0023533D47|nr:TetR/AcrR family transcriptional regulator [Hyphomonas adhaerens]